MAGWPTATALVWMGVLLSAISTQAADFDLIGHIQPEQPLPVYLQGANAPFRATTEADSQLGIAYFYSGQLDIAEKHLAEAKRIDPAHFSHPQWLLAQIHLRRNEPKAAAGELQDLLKQHPD